MSLHIGKEEARFLALQLAEAFADARYSEDANWTYRCTEAVPDLQNPGTTRKVPLNYYVGIVLTPQSLANNDVVIDGGALLLRVNIERRTVEELPDVG